MFVCLLEPAVLKDVFASKVLKFSNLLHKVDNKHSIFIFFFSNKLCLCQRFLRGYAPLQASQEGHLRQGSQKPHRQDREACAA